jgi:choline-sulfatase
VLLILGDDHAAYALGCYGSSIARTPNLDRLAAGGALFLRAYANSPVCTPSRQSLLTGRYPHAAGVTLLKTALAEEEVTLADVLGEAGYETAAIGKMHFNSSLRHGFGLLVDLPEHRERLRLAPPPPLPASDGPGGIETLGPWRPFRDHARVWLNGSYLPFPARNADMAGTFFAGEAARFLRRERGRPFFLVVSFHEPHSPFHFPIEYRGRHDPERLPLLELGPDDAPQVPLIFRDLTPREKQRIAAAYYTSVEFLDKNVGLVLDALRESGRERDTLVIYAGDHGYTLGHHGRFEKHCFYEEAVRAPLIVRCPGRIAAGERRTELVELADIFPTALEAAGVEPPPERHGRSLLELLRGAGEPPWRRHAVSIYCENEEAMVRTERWKLIYSTGKRAREDGYRTDDPTPGRYRRLFDLERDPDEMRDLSAEPEHRELIAELEEALLERLETTAPADLKPPPGLSREEKLDRLLIPAELQRSG